MDPLAGRVVSQAASGVLAKLRTLTEATYSEKLIARIVGKLPPDLPRPSGRELRKIRRLLADEATWPLLVHPSREVNDELARGIAGLLTPERPPDMNLAMARDMAGLAVAEFIGSLHPDDRANVSAELTRYLADRLADTGRAIEELRREFSGDVARASNYLAGDLVEYRNRLLAALDRRRPQHVFTIPHGLDESYSDIRELLPLIVADESRLAIHAKAGAGKSAVVVDLAGRLVENGDHLVIFVDLKNWLRGSPEDLDSFSVTIEDVLDSSIVPVASSVVRELHSALGPRARVIWIIDGINELTSELSNRILAVVAQHLRGIMRSSLCVTDRSPSRYVGGEWRLIGLSPLEVDEVERHISAPVERSSGDDPHWELLRTPFFLDVALTDGWQGWRSGVEALRGLFTERVGLNGGELASLSEFALSTYVARRGLRFSLAELTAGTDASTTRKLLESGVMTWADENDLLFYHQLLHDYLASCAVSVRPDRWNPQSFDALSLDTNTYESVFMVLDQLDSEVEITQYLTALYDWNWFGTVRCVERALRDLIPIPKDLLIVLSALLAEKRFDPVQGSRARADEWSARLDAVTGFDFRRAHTISDVVGEVERIVAPGGAGWVEGWWALFQNLRHSDHVSTEYEIAMLGDLNPFIGWTASQMIRWCHLDLAGMRQVRALFTGARRASDDVSRSVRWRAVHALGRHPSQENLQLLLDAIDHDDYSWVVYGAVRSALEMAAIDGLKLAETVLAEIDSRMQALPPLPLSQLAWASRYEGTPGEWAAKVWPLLVRAHGLQTDEVEKERWSRRLDAFRIWSSREVTSG